MREDRLKDNELMEILKIIAPGTPLRDGLENILKARTGALIVIGDSYDVLSLVDGGFYINKEYSPAHLYELAKMDGAIIISKDAKKILYANALLIPDPSIPTNETGTRHKSAERVAKQTGEIVICISQRRSLITLFKGDCKYVLKDTSMLLARANQALQTLEKYNSVLINALGNLSVLEFEDNVTLDDVAYVIQRTEMVMRIVDEVDRYICELGNEGRLIRMQLEELLVNVEEDARMVIEDYMVRNDPTKTSDDILATIRMFDDDELLDLTNIYTKLGYKDSTVAMNVTPRGFRIMSMIPRLPMAIMNKLLEKFMNLQGILKASSDELDTVEGIGEIRARAIKEGLKRIREQLIVDFRHINSDCRL
ncbi:MAG TPA: DNA integrity scanning diadenylate cyclase DisA [Pseudobacteroides sp.]|nr:DNA integrity scanning diadenylate cyclase DisA [Pseudobacteroides sp.]